MYRPPLGIFMGTVPVSDLANDFAFVHDFKFLKVMIDQHVHAKSNAMCPFIRMHS